MFKKVYVEITNHCNLQCSFCHGTKRTKEFMSIANFQTILTKLKPYTKYLYLHLMGEPLMHPNINELIDMASSSFYLNITTNGYLITKIAHNKNIRQVNISLHSFNPQNKVSLEDYLESICNSCALLKKNKTIINYRFSYLNNYYHTNIVLKKGFKIADNIFIEKDEEFIWPSLDNEFQNDKGTCKALKDHLGILVDGTIVPCCLDSEGIIKLGNIYTDEIETVMESDLYQSLKQGFKDNKRIHKLCQKCAFRLKK